MTAAVTDFTQFTTLRAAADRNDPAALRDVAGQFEALFIQSMLENMREASFGDPLFGNSDQHEMYQNMLDQQLAVEMASGKGIGLAEMLVRQLGGETDSRPTGEVGIPPYRAAQPPLAAERAPAETRPDWSTPEAFARDIWPHAERVAAELNVSPLAIVAQAALETGWGAHVPLRGDGRSSFNLFGIKAGTSWRGDAISKQTLEFESGAMQKREASFRAYDDLGASFDDYSAFIGANPRYASAVNAADVEGFARALQQSGYATDPDYASKIRRVADSETMQRAIAPFKKPGAVPLSVERPADST